MAYTKEEFMQRIRQSALNYKKKDESEAARRTYSPRSSAQGSVERIHRRYKEEQQRKNQGAADYSAPSYSYAGDTNDPLMDAARDYVAEQEQQTPNLFSNFERLVTHRPVVQSTQTARQTPPGTDFASRLTRNFTKNLALGAAAEYDRLQNYDFDAGDDQLAKLAQEVAEAKSNYTNRFSVTRAGYDSIEAERTYLDAQKRYNAFKNDYRTATTFRDERERQAKYTSYMESPDFGRFAAQGAALENPDAQETARGVKIQNKVKFAKENESHLILGATHSSQHEAVGYLPYTYLTEQEENIYNYLLAKEGEAAADEYLGEMLETLNYRMGTG